MVWQVKKFTTPLSSDQKSQIKKSWTRFWKAYPAKGHPVLAYYLVTPWTPTEKWNTWFMEELSGGAGFPRQWEGQAFFNGLAADYPQVLDRMTKGVDMLESMVNAKAMLASSPVEITRDASMLDALAAREAAIRGIRDLVSDTYIVNTGTRSVMTGTWPQPAAGEVGVLHRYTPLGNDRYWVETVVPINDESLIDDPISLNIEFLIDTDSPDHQQIREWVNWGVPLEGVVARSQQLGGPFAEDCARTSLISLYPLSRGPHPDMLLRVQDDAGDQKGTLVLAVEEVTLGLSGHRLRVVANSPSHAVQIEFRLGPDTEEDDTTIRIRLVEGQSPESTRADLSVLAAANLEDEIHISVAGAETFYRATGLELNQRFLDILQLAKDLELLQSFTTDAIRMPGTEDLTEDQVERVRLIAEVYAGQIRTATWTSLEITVLDPESFQAFGDSPVGAIVKLFEPDFLLGRRKYRVTSPLLTVYASPTLAPGISAADLVAGSVVELVPSVNNQCVVRKPDPDTLQALQQSTSETTSDDGEN